MGQVIVRMAIRCLFVLECLTTPLQLHSVA